jgi:uncharacterized membrane protein YhaH (DUF805 family)
VVIAEVIYLRFVLQLFKFTGRLRRRAFFWRVPALYVLAFGCYGLPVLAEVKLNSTAAHWSIISQLAIATCFYLMLTQSVKRLHDIDLRGWWLLLALLPVVNMLLGSGMQFVSGTPGPNRFGPDPRRGPTTPQ